jgi:hypothetical protein
MTENIGTLIETMLDGAKNFIQGKEVHDTKPHSNMTLKQYYSAFFPG